MFLIVGLGLESELKIFFNVFLIGDMEGVTPCGHFLMITFVFVLCIFFNLTKLKSQFWLLFFPFLTGSWVEEWPIPYRHFL